MMTKKEGSVRRLSDQKLLAIIGDKQRPCVERGAAIDKLTERDKSQTAIADALGISKVFVSHLRTCFLNLKGTALQMCRTGRMNADACYKLACLPSHKQDEVLGLALEMRQIRDKERSGRSLNLKGRRTPAGQITARDIDAAIVQSRTRTTKNEDTWPAEVLAAIGAFPDFPELAELRRGYAPDETRESLD